MDYEAARKRIVSQATQIGKEVKAHTSDKLEQRFLIFSLMMLLAIAILTLMQNNHLWDELRALRTQNQELAEKVKVFYTVPAAYPGDELPALPPPTLDIQEDLIGDAIIRELNRSTRF